MGHDDETYHHLTNCLPKPREFLYRGGCFVPERQSTHGRNSNKISGLSPFPRNNSVQKNNNASEIQP